MLLQEISGPERGTEDFCHQKGNTKLTLTVLVQVKNKFSLQW